ncbi:MAG: hypothetical protein KDD02_25370 [Phaeodactylibacter sp.]|nr:hypothetical protein [Phaeodactylibacter sp.]
MLIRKDYYLQPSSVNKQGLSALNEPIFNIRDGVKVVETDGALSVVTYGLILEEITELAEVANRHRLYISIVADGNLIHMAIHERQ